MKKVPAEKFLRTYTNRFILFYPILSDTPLLNLIYPTFLYSILLYNFFNDYKAILDINWLKSQDQDQEEWLVLHF